MSQHHADRGPDPHFTSGPSNRPRLGALPMYKVLLLRDASLDLMFVVRTVMQLTRLCRAEATNKMWQAVHHGQSTLLVTYRERAELFVEQFNSTGLTTRLEPA